MKWRGFIVMLTATALMLFTAGAVAAQSEQDATVVVMSATIPLTVQLPAADAPSSAANDAMVTVNVDTIAAIRDGNSASTMLSATAETGEEAGVVVTVAKHVEDVKIESDVTVQVVAAESANEDSPANADPAPEKSEPEPAQPVGPTANRNANLRGGPGTNYAVTGGAEDGQTLTPVGTNADGSWYVLDDNRWIAAFLVDDAPSGLPVVEAPPAPTPAPAPAASNGGGDDDDPAAMIQTMSDRIAQSPDDIEAYFLRGVGYFIRGNYANAIQDFTQVIQRNPSIGDAYAFRGVANAIQGNEDQAIRDLERALQLGVDDSIRGDVENALQVLREGQ